MNYQKIITDIINEVESAKQKHPFWPDDLIHQTAIIQEECGESVRESLNIVYKEGGTYENLKKEIIQTAATCIRCLDYLNKREI